MIKNAPAPMRDFELEVYFAEWEFTAKHHMTASDLESMSIAELLDMASAEDRAAFETLGLGYTETIGAPELRAEIARTYEALSSENVLCLAGAGEGLYAIARVLLDTGDHVVVPVPNYQSAETVPLSICEVTGVPMDYGPDGWWLDVDRVKAAVRPETKLISLNMPHNPTGALLPVEALNGLIDFARERGIYILSDEVYRGVELDPVKTLPQIADMYERGISLNVMSKAYGLPGLRIGWCASRDLELLTKVERYKHYLSICNSGPSEQLALIALRARGKVLARNVSILAENAVLFETLLADFPGLIEWQRPDGGCVAFPRYVGPGSCEEFCRVLIEESGVLLLPPSVYRSELGETSKDHFRIGLGRDQVVKDGLIAMRAHFERHFG